MSQNKLYEEYYLIFNSENYIRINGHDMNDVVHSEFDLSEKMKQIKLTDSQEHIIKEEFKFTCKNLENNTWYIFARNTKEKGATVLKIDNCEANDNQRYLLFYNFRENGVYLNEGIICIEHFSFPRYYTFKEEVPIILIKINQEIEFIAIETDLIKDVFSSKHKEVLVRYPFKEKFNLNKFKDYLSNKDLVYSDSDLIKIEAAAQSNYLTILSGCCGIGKSELVKAYIEFMTGNDKSRYAMVTITKSFTEASLFQGYYSNSRNLYQPDKNGVINIIREANKEENQCKTFYIFIDEMNIAPVENWLCEFLSKMETHDDLVLYDDKAELRTVIDDIIESNNDIIPPAIVRVLKDIYKPLAYEHSYSLKNIKFIGTINMDESGTILSERVLDRATIITLERPNIDKVIKASKKFNNLSKCQQIFINIAKEIERKIEEVKEELYAQHKDYSHIERVNISPRTLKKSLMYIKSAESIDGSQDKVDEIIDSVLYGKVFLKFSMNSNKTLIEKMLEVCNSSSCNLKTSVEYLHRMQNALKYY